MNYNYDFLSFKPDPPTKEQAFTFKLLGQLLSKKISRKTSTPAKSPTPSRRYAVSAND